MTATRLLPYAAAVTVSAALAFGGAPAQAAPHPQIAPLPAAATAATATAATATRATPAPPAAKVSCAVRKCVALTFDDGPGPYTDRLLATLRAKKVPATFYLLGQSVAARPATARHIARAGHELGVHTWSHRQLTRLGEGDVRSEIARTQTILRRVTGVAPKTLRPPYGAQNPTVRRVAGSLGLPVVNWNVDPLDWKDRSAATVTSRVLGSTRKGSIVLLHDIHASTVAAVPAIIDGLRARGYTFVTVSQLRTMKPGQLYTQR